MYWGLESCIVNDEQKDLRTLIATAILGDTRLGQAVIEVEDQDGTVTLRGIATTEEDKKLAEDIVYRQEGVVSVINKLTFD
jgi:osmotically-inducible protein OsmY